MTHIHHHEQDPITILMEEHRVIERAIRLLEEVAARLDAGKQVEPTILINLLDFIRNLADRCHHGKEEKILFQTFSEHGIPVEGGPIGVMLFEHEEGRKAVKAMAEAALKIKEGDWRQTHLFSSNAKGYSQLLTQHIYKEDNILYPMGGRLLSKEEKEDLVRRFEKVEREEMGEGVHEKYIRLIEELEDKIL
ncbi:MAG: hemerythrin domain-containing protein [Nitrososphaerales archaeon]